MPDECGFPAVTRTQRRSSATSCVRRSVAPYLHGRWRRSLADPDPGLPAAEDSAEDAALNPQGVRALHRDGGIVDFAAVGIMNATGPPCTRRLHVDENLFAVRHGISAKVLAALLDANHPTVFFRV